MPKVPAFVYVASAALIGIGAIAFFRSRPPSVDVILPREMVVTESLSASGRLRGRLETSVGARVSGRIAQVLVREGDIVRAGQALAQLDDEVLRAQVDQAGDAVRTARAQVDQAGDSIQTARAQLAVASRPPLSADVARLKADVDQNIAVARARLAASRQKLVFAQRRFTELKRGPRVEEIEASKAQAQQAEASQEQASRDLDRQNALVKEGAVATADAEKARTAFLVAKRTLESAQAQLRLLQAGTRTEQIEQGEADERAATADVRAAEATLAGAKASGDAQLRSLLSSPRPEDILVAKDRVAESLRARDVATARLAEAERALEVAKNRLADVTVTAPFGGTITKIVTESGGVTGPNTPVVQLVRTDTPEIRIDMDEGNLGKLRVGQDAIVSADAFPGQTFAATVREIGAEIDADRGTVEVRLTPSTTPKWLRPGQTLSVNIVLGQPTKRLVVPLTSVNTIGGASSLLVANDGVVEKRGVKVGPSSGDGVPVIDGVSASDLVIRNPAGRVAGERVTPKTVSEKPKG